MIHHLTTRWSMALVTLALLAGCGSNNDLGDVKTPTLSITQPSGGSSILLRLPTMPNRPEEQDYIEFRNAGEADLQITKLEWVAQPPGLFMRRGQQNVNACSECGSSVCLPSAGGGICIETGTPDLPITLAPGLADRLTFYVAAGTQSFSCPTPGPSVPELYRSRYCGELVMTTNARTDVTDQIVAGKATFYFLKDDSSGSLRLPTSFLEFTGVSPGTTDVRTFTIENASTTEPLTLTSVEVDGFGQLLTVSGNTSATIQPGSSESYNLQLAVPSNATTDQLDFNTTITVNSSDSNALLNKVSVKVSQGTGKVGQINVAQAPIKFDAATTQTLTITNVGGAALQINGFDFEPRSAADFYTVTLNGQPATGRENISHVEGMNTRQYTITFNRPAGRGDDSSVGQLIILHSDEAAGKESRVALLGDEGDVPFGVLSPLSMSFSANASEAREQAFAITNLGTATLTLDSVSFMASQGAADEFQINGLADGTTVPPGGVVSGTLRFTPANTDPDVLSATFNSSDNAGPEAIFLTVNASAIPDSPPSPAIKASFTTNAKVGERTTLSADGSSPAATGSNAQWVLLQRPAASTLRLDRFGASVAFTPDAEGAYKVALILVDSGLSAQKVIEFNAVP